MGVSRRGAGRPGSWAYRAKDAVGKSTARGARDLLAIALPRASGNRAADAVRSPAGERREDCHLVAVLQGKLEAGLRVGRRAAVHEDGHAGPQAVLRIEDARRELLAASASHELEEAAQSRPLLEACLPRRDNGGKRKIASHEDVHRHATAPGFSPGSRPLALTRRSDAQAGSELANVLAEE